MTATTHIALMRAVNLPGYQPVAMVELRDFFMTLRLANPRSLLQSGNVVFQSRRKGASLERFLELEASRRLALDTDFHVRSAAEWRAVIAGNPFKQEAAHDPARLLLACLKDAAAARYVKALQEAITGPERVRAADRHLYIVYPDGVGRSRLTTALIERKLGTRATSRNWNTVLKLDALANE